MSPFTKPRIAYLRGSTLDSSESVVLRALQSQFDLVVVGSRATSNQPGLEVTNRFCAGAALDRVPKVRRLYRGGLERLLGDSNHIGAVARTCRSSRLIDVAETHNLYSYQAARAAARMGTPLVVTAYENTPFHKEERRRSQRNKQFVRDAAARFVARTEQIRGCLLAEGVAPDLIDVIYSGVDVHRFAPRPKDPAQLARYGLSPSDMVVLFAGRLVWEKGLTDLVRSFRSLRAPGPTTGGRCKLLVVGEGRERPAAEGLARRLGLGRSVVFAGQVRFDDMAAMYNLADVTVLPSKPYVGWQEQESRVIREAMASGNAVVVSASGGNAELLGNAGLVVPPADHVALTEALARLLSDDAARRELGHQARKRAVRDFDVDVVAAQQAELYRRVIDGQAGG
jgi:alpha-maltose-1-phosphate synthase